MATDRFLHCHGLKDKTSLGTALETVIAVVKAADFGYGLLLPMYPK